MTRGVRPKNGQRRTDADMRRLALGSLGRWLRDYRGPSGSARTWDVGAVRRQRASTGTAGATIRLLGKDESRGGGRTANRAGIAGAGRTAEPLSGERGLWPGDGGDILFFPSRVAVSSIRVRRGWARTPRCRLAATGSGGYGAPEGARRRGTPLVLQDLMCKEIESESHAARLTG